MTEKTDIRDSDEKVVEIEMERLRNFTNHPFKVIGDSQMIELQDSIKKYGVLNPLIVRPRKEGYYEIISGHRRKYAAERLGYKKIPVIIRMMQDDEAVVTMVDSNLQREQITPSEKAYAYKMKYDAIKKKAGRKNCGQVDHNTGKRSMDFMVSGEKERKTMNYETFKQEFAEDIKEKLYERGYDDVRISFNNVEKTNQNYEAMSVVPEGNNVGVNFNIENAFASYEHTDDYAGVLASATMVIADGLDRAPTIDVSALMDYENMKEKLSVEVISADANADLLANVPHDRMEDLAVVYRFVMESSEDGRASILVTKNLMDRMGVSHEQLRADALENSPEIRPVVIMGMNEVMKEMIGSEVYEMFGIPDDAEEKMYVAREIKTN